MSSPADAPTYSLPHIEAHPGDFLGPAIVSVFLQALQTGYILAQVFQFYEHAHREPRWICALVAFVCAMAFFQTGAFFSAQWKQYVIGFADWIGVVVPEWPQRVQSIVTACMAAPVQGFLIWRCYHVLHRKWLPMIPLIGLLIGSIISAGILTAMTVPVDFTPLPSGAPSEPKQPLSPVFILSLLFPAVLDLIITSILLVYLLRARSGVYTRKLRRILLRLIVVVWEAAIPPSACAVVSVVTYIFLRNVNFWDLTFQAVIGKLYVMSLLATLCARASLSLDADTLPTHFPTLSANRSAVLDAQTAIRRVSTSASDPPLASPPSALHAPTSPSPFSIVESEKC